MLRIPHARGLLCGIDDAAERSRFNRFAHPEPNPYPSPSPSPSLSPSSNPSPSPSPNPNPNLVNSDAARLLRVPPWGAKCFQPCSSELAKWLTPEQISSGGGARGNQWTLHVKPPPPFKAGTCVRNMED